MEKTKMLNQIRTLLNIEVKLEEQKLENGTVVSAEAFEKGKEIFIVTDDEKVAMPVGEYILEDGRLLVVEAEGMIADVRDVSDEVPAKEETEDLEEVIETEVPEEVVQEVEAIVEAVVEVIAPVLEEVKSEIEELKKKFSDMDVKEEEKKEELSAARKPIKHNPEAKAPQKKQMQFAKGQFNTTLDRVLNKLNK
jgi:Mg2+ and Co2+ transporter CorA